MDHTIVNSNRNISASGVAESRKYHKVIGSSGKIWLYSTDDNFADYLYVEGGPNSDGFGGRELTFPLVEGGKVKLKGPWHTNSESFTSDTGIQAENFHLTWGVIAKGRESKYPQPDKYIDVLHIDEEPVVGNFDRIEIMAKHFANTLNIKVYLFSSSCGGSHSGWEEPDNGA